MLFGCVTVGTYKICGKELVYNVIDHAFDAGYRMIGMCLVKLSMLYIVIIETCSVTL